MTTLSKNETIVFESKLQSEGQDKVAAAFYFRARKFSRRSSYGGCGSKQRKQPAQADRGRVRALQLKSSAYGIVPQF